MSTKHDFIREKSPKGIEPCLFYQRIRHAQINPFYWLRGFVESLMTGRVKFVSVIIEERMWKRWSDKLPNSEALKVLREVINYITKKLKLRIDDTDVWREGVAFFSKGKEFLTVEVTTKSLRIHFYPSAGALFNGQEKFSVERVNLWKSSYHKASSKYRAMTAWVSKEEHLPGIKKIIDSIPTSQ